MQSSNFSKLFFGLMLILLQTACVKEGPVGPAGAAGVGTTGAQGTQGTQGVTGAAGKDGNANVKGQLFLVNASDWIKTFYGTSTTEYYYRATLPVPAITKDVLDKGLVVTFRSNSSTNANSFISLPYSSAFAFGSTTYITNWTPVHYEGGVTVWKEDSDLLTLAPTGGYTFKVVVVTPFGLASNPNVDWKNYAAVAKALDLE